MNPYQKKLRTQLTRWMKQDKLMSCIEPFTNDKAIEGRDYFIISNRKKLKPKYAIFIQRERRRDVARRKEDESCQRFRKALSMLDLILMVLPQKENGIPILKTLSKRL